MLRTPHTLLDCDDGLLTLVMVMVVAALSTAAADSADDELTRLTTGVKCDEVMSKLVNGVCSRMIQPCVTEDANADVDRPSGVSSAETTACTNHVRKLEKASVHNSAMTHAGNVFCSS